MGTADEATTRSEWISTIWMTDRAIRKTTGPIMVKDERMGNLDGVVNLGRVLVGELAAVGITELSELGRLGSVETACRIAWHGGSVCANKLYALEGAIRGVRWHAIPVSERAELWRTFQETAPPPGDRPL